MQIEKAKSFMLLAWWLKSVVNLLACLLLDELINCCLLGYKVKAQKVTSLLLV